MMTRSIEIIGARTNNLRDVTLAIPKHRIVVFTGVSGSGKSSLVFDTIAAESQRQLNETYSSFIRHRLPHYGVPDADQLANLPVTVLIDQKRLGGNARSTVGTATDIHALLRLLFSRAGSPAVGEASQFSFNNVDGMCPSCEGIGRVESIDLDRLLDRSKSLNQGPFRFPGWNPGSARWKRYALTGFFDNDKPLGDYRPDEWRRLTEEVDVPVTDPLPGWYESSAYEGVLPRFRRSYLTKDRDALPEAQRAALDQVVLRQTCPACGGGRLRSEVLACRIAGRNIAECAAMEIGDLIAFLGDVQAGEAAPVVAALIDRLKAMMGLGLDYLSLDRETPTLSGGESQRIKIVRHLGSSLSDIAYIFDEPSTGLHPRDVHQVAELLRRLRDKGNSVLVVEHDPDVIAIADHVVDMGPGAGRNGGEVVFAGTLEGLRKSRGATGRALARPRELRDAVRRPSERIAIRDATCHNIHGVDVDIPLGVLTVVVGVAGSGKSTLTGAVLARQHPEIVRIDQGALGGSRRSTSATYLGIHERIRGRFAEASGKQAGLFSSNAAGACPVCRGLGVLRTDLAFMDAVETPCQACGGTGFSDAALAVQVKGRTIADIARMTAAEARALFADDAAICAPLERMEEVGLGYMPIGQQLSSLSGGERQRLRLADELGRDSAIYLLDEPSSGLHLRDVERLLQLFDRLIERGKSLIVVEHNLDVIAAADWIIEMGPGAGKRGGKVIFEGTPAAMLTDRNSVTGPFLERYLRAEHALAEQGNAE